jgi:DNA-binding GntR family transcriptional regulator
MTAQLAATRPSTPPPARAFLKDEAYSQLKRRLFQGDYPPGSFLSERQLARDLGMSKTPIKAALERLEAEGYVTVSPQQGIVVRELSIREIADQYEIRAALESFVVRTLAGRLTATQIEALQVNLESQARLRGTSEVTLGVELDAAFHTQFVEFLGNQEIIRVFGQLRDRMQRIVTRVFQHNPTRLESSYDEHVAIAAAVISGRGEQAANLIVAHLERGKQLILAPRS